MTPQPQSWSYRLGYWTFAALITALLLAGAVGIIGLIVGMALRAWRWAFVSVALTP